MPVRRIEDGVVAAAQGAQEPQELQRVAEGVGLLERNEAEAEAFREVRVPGGEKQIHLRSGDRLAQSEAERDGEERVSHPVVGADDEEPPQAVGARETSLHRERTARDAGDRPCPE
jgi:hypothetical protein